MKNKKSEYYKLLAELSILDRCHNSPEMKYAYELLVGHYKGARLLKYDVDSEVNKWLRPPFWTCNNAELIDENGNIIVSYKDNKLSVFSYSPYVDKKISFEQLQNHLLYDSNRPDSTCFHFRNQYRHWDPEWGFSVPYNKVKSLDKSLEYHVKIDSEFNFNEPMLQSDFHHQGSSDKIYLLIGHFDHPAQVNDGLAGCIVAYEIIRRLQDVDTRFSYRAFASVEMVGSAYYVNNSSSNMKSIVEAIFFSFSGIKSTFAYQESYKGGSLLDRIVLLIFSFCSNDKPQVFKHRELVGNDESVFDSVGFDIPCGTLMRWPFPEYHTDKDSMDITYKSSMEDSINFGMRIINIIENNFYISLRNPGLPCLGNPNVDLYLSPDNVSGILNNSNIDFDRFSCELPDNEVEYLQNNTHVLNQFMQDILRMSNGKYTLFDIAEKSNMPFEFVHKYAKMLQEKEIVKLHELSI